MDYQIDIVVKIWHKDGEHSACEVLTIEGLENLQELESKVHGAISRAESKFNAEDWFKEYCPLCEA